MCEFCPMGKKKTDEYNKAYDFFCNSELNKGDIAKVVGVSTKQLGVWIKNDEWELDRAAAKSSTKQIIRGFLQDIANIQKKARDEKRAVNSSEGDTITKLTNSISKLKNSLNLSVYHTVLSECLQYFQKENLEHAKLFATDMLEFLQFKSKQIKSDC